MSTTRWPSLRDTSGPMARSPIGPRTSGRGQQGVAGEAQRTPDAHDAGAGRRPEPGRDPEGVALGQGAQAPAGPDRRTAGRDGHERVGEPDLAAQVDRLGPAPEEPVGPQVDHAAPEIVALQGAAEARRGLEHGDRRVHRAAAVAPPVSSQAAARPLMPPPTTTTRRAATSGAPSAGDDQIGQHGDERGVVVEGRGARVGEADLAPRCRPPRRRGRRAPRDGRRRSRWGRRRRHRSRRRRPGGGPRRARRGRARARACARALPGHQPVVEAGRLGDEPGRLGQLLGVGVAASRGCARAASAR